MKLFALVEFLIITIDLNTYQYTFICLEQFLLIGLAKINHVSPGYQ